MASPALTVLPGGSAGTPYNRFWWRPSCSGWSGSTLRCSTSPSSRQTTCAPTGLAFEAAEAERGPVSTPTSLLTSHKALRAFLKWIQANNRQLQMDPALLAFQRPRQPYKQAVLFDLGELHRILKVCETPAEELAVRLLVGSGSRNFAASG